MPARALEYPPDMVAGGAPATKSSGIWRERVDLPAKAAGSLHNHANEIIRYN